MRGMALPSSTIELLISNLNYGNYAQSRFWLYNLEETKIRENTLLAQIHARVSATCRSGILQSGSKALKLITLAERSFPWVNDCATSEKVLHGVASAYEHVDDRYA